MYCIKISVWYLCVPHLRFYHLLQGLSPHTIVQKALLVEAQVNLIVRSFYTGLARDPLVL